jgi:hypothetical protein
MKKILWISFCFCLISCIENYHRIRYKDSKTKYTSGFFSGTNYLLILNYCHDTTLRFSLENILKENYSYDTTIRLPIDNSNQSILYPKMNKFFSSSKTEIKSGIMFTNLDSNGQYYYCALNLELDNKYYCENDYLLTEREKTVYVDAVKKFCNSKGQEVNKYFICDSIPVTNHIRVRCFKK